MDDLNNPDQILKQYGNLVYQLALARTKNPVDAGSKIGGGYDPNGTFEFEGNFETLINADEIAALELWGQRIPLQ